LTRATGGQYNWPRSTYKGRPRCWPVERKGRSELSEVRASEGESFENLLKRFNRRIQQSGILREIKKRQHFEPPSIRRKKKEAAKRRKSRRNS